jgi:ATPase subunit of ABC transporter with duplicated ATPase domains
MPAFITLADLSYSTADGTSLFSHLDLSFPPHRTGLVGRNGVGKSTLLKIISGEIPVQSGSVATSGTLGTLRQTVQVNATDTIADLFGITDALDLLTRAANGEAEAHELAEADWTLEARVEAALTRMGLHATPDTPLATLSGGQRTRAMLAALILSDPDMILLDEPTNNLDRDGRKAVIDLLAGWRGGAIVVSHDRELLDTMDSIVELTTLGATTYGGNYTHYRERKAIDLAAAQHDVAAAERRLSEIERKAQQTRERQAQRDNQGRRAKAKGGQPRILMNAMQGRAESTAGDNARLADRMRTDAEATASRAREKLEVLQPLTVALSPTGLANGKTVLEVDDLSGGHDPNHPIIRDVSLKLIGPERVAIVGPNGVGKTTLLKLLTGSLEPTTGSTRIAVPYALLDQQVSLLDPEKTIRDNFRALNPDAEENTARAALARFQFRADAALKPVGQLSGGQMLRAGLAATIGGTTPPQLLILDEPTNHLDIDAIEAVEAGLNAYDGALLVVSHDRPFLDAIGITRWIDLG